MQAAHKRPCTRKPALTESAAPTTYLRTAAPTQLHRRLQKVLCVVQYQIWPSLSAGVAVALIVGLTDYTLHRLHNFNHETSCHTRKALSTSQPKAFCAAEVDIGAKSSSSSTVSSLFGNSEFLLGSVWPSLEAQSPSQLSCKPDPPGYLANGIQAFWCCNVVEYVYTADDIVDWIANCHESRSEWVKYLRSDFSYAFKDRSDYACLTQPICPATLSSHQAHLPSTLQ